MAFRSYGCIDRVFQFFYLLGGLTKKKLPLNNVQDMDVFVHHHELPKIYISARKENQNHTQIADKTTTKKILGGFRKMENKKSMKGHVEVAKKSV